MLDQFFNQQLRPFVDTSGPVWKAQAVAGVARAGLARRSWRNSSAPPQSATCSLSGGAQPNGAVRHHAETLDTGAKQVTLDLDGTDRQSTRTGRSVRPR